MSSGEALVESGVATVKSSCLSVPMKIIIGVIASAVIVTATVTPSVLLLGGSSGSDGQVGNVSPVINESSSTTNPSMGSTGVENTDTNTVTVSHTNSEVTNLNESDHTTPASGENNNTGETSTSLDQNDVNSTADPTGGTPGPIEQTTSQINSENTNQNGTEETTATSGGNISTATRSTSLIQNVSQSVDYQTSSPITTARVSPTTTPLTTTLPPCSSPYSQTLVFMFYDRNQDRVYLKGLSSNFTHISLGAGFSEYDRLAVGDTHLDWNTEKESGQPAEALGTPTAKTSNDNSSAIYFPLNTYGNNYWVMNVCLDCSTNDWIEFKAYTSQAKWENGITQQSSCTGTAGGNKPTNGNHAAKCGKINVYTYESGACRIDNL